DPRVTEIHHVVIAPKNGASPPAAPGGWSLIKHAGAWHLQSRKRAKNQALNGDAAQNLAVLRRDRERITSLFKDIDGAAISSTLERLVARWVWPFELAEDNQYRTSMRRRLGVSDRRALEFFGLCAEIKRNHDYHIFDNEQLRSKAIATLDPCRRIALAQG